MKRLAACSAVAAGFALTSGCASEGEGTLAVSVWGEAFIEQGIGAEEFADGWSVTFDKFLVHLGPTQIADGAQLGGSVPGQLVDLVVPGEKTLGEVTLEAKPWTSVGYSLRKVTADATIAPSVSEADRAQMQREGWSVRVVGEGHKDGVRKRFDWGFGTEVEYRECRSEVDGKEQMGAVVTGGQRELVQLTVHGDHLFYDDLASPEAELRFANMAAADADGDGRITLAELDAVLREDLQGGSYSVGGAADVFSYGDFVRALTRSLGHYRGEGHCVQSAR